MNRKILVVDDNEKNRKLVSLILQKEYKIIEAEDGEQAVKLAREIIPDLILMDIQLPVMDGTEALKLLRANDITSKIPVIALTSYVMKGDKDKFLEQGFDEYIAKPLKAGELRDAVKKHIKEGGI
jgi:two-component system cell cycle response regulator DivK